VDLDRWLTDPIARTRHRRESRADPERLWKAAETVRLRDCRVLGRLVRARIPGLEAGLTFAELFRTEPFNLLEQGPGYVMSGLCGRIWTVRGDFASLTRPAEFLEWSEPGTTRVLFAHWVRETERGSELISEVRVTPVDRRASLYVRTLGPFITAFQGLVGVEALTAAVRKAERDARSPRPKP
jgi:hypothetical protein